MFMLSVVAIYFSKTQNNSAGSLFKKEFSCVSYNLYFKNKYKEQTLKKIIQLNPDVLAFQEVTPSWDRFLNVKLKRKYQYKRSKPLNGTHGLAIYSKHKILSHYTINNRHGRPIAQFVELFIKGKKILIINSHLASPAIAFQSLSNFWTSYKNNYRQRKHQVELIHSHRKKSKINNQIFLGDLNITQFEPLYLDLLKTWNDVNNYSGDFMAFTFPNTNRLFPIFKIDYILIRGNLNPDSVKTLNGGQSDHLAIYAEIQF